MSISDLVNSEEECKPISGSDSLKGCPFCGSTAELSKTLYDQFYVGCENKQCIGSEICSLYNSGKEAISRWNKRV